MLSFPKHESYKDSGEAWLGEIPQHWQVVRAKRIFGEVSEKNYPNAPLLSVTQSKGVVPRDELEQRVVMPVGQLQTFKLVRKDDFVISLRSFQGGIEYSEYTGLVSPAYTVLRKQQNISSSYLKWLLKSPSFVSELNTSVTGIRQGKNIDFKDFSLSFLPIPEIEEQKRIANFLDRTTTDIDRAIAQKQCLIELLQEQKAILINRAVTKGLNPNVPMRDSGIEWLGEIPKHWSKTKIKHIASFISGGTPSKENIEFWDGNIPWVSPKDMKQRYIDSSEDKITSKALQKTTLQLLDIKTVLIVVRGMILARKIPVSLTRVPTTINQDMKGLIVNDVCLPEYMLFVLEGVNNDLSVLLEESGHGTKTLPTEGLSNFALSIPPKDEQIEIIQTIKENEAEVNSSIEVAVSQISLLEELKRIVVAEAVTGKIKV